MIRNKKVVVVMPAYNARNTLEKTLSDIDRDYIDDIILVDDASQDNTAEFAEGLGLSVIRHDENRGYGGNQKTCYRAAISAGADIVVMLHPDYQYDPRLLVPMASMLAYGVYDIALGSRVLAQNSVRQGMPRYKYVANRVLTLTENILTGSKLSEYHTGYRAFTSTVLTSLNLAANSDDFVFDNQMLVQALNAGFRIGEISCPTKYEAQSSSISFSRSVKYGFGVLGSAAQYRLNKWKIGKYPFLVPLEDPAPLHTVRTAPAQEPVPRRD